MVLSHHVVVVLFITIVVLDCRAANDDCGDQGRTHTCKVRSDLQSASVDVGDWHSSEFECNSETTTTTTTTWTTDGGF